MKKRILSAILVSALVLSMAGCNGETPTSEPVSQQSQTSTSENKEQSSSTSEAVSSESTSSESTSASSSSENTSTSTNSESIPSASSSSENNPSGSSSSSSKPVSSSSSTSTKPVVPTNQPSIVRCYFEDGRMSPDNWTNTWHFETSDKQHYAYNLAEKKIYKLGELTGTAVRTMGQLVYYYDPAGYKTYIQNASTQQTVLPSSEGYRIVGFCWGIDRILVTKVEKGFSGNKLLIGVMNSKMEWVYPLTEIPLEYLYSDFDLYGDKLLIRGYDMEQLYIFSFKDSSITPFSTDDWCNWRDSIWHWHFSRDKILLSFWARYDGFWCFDNTSENGVHYDKYDELIGYTPSGNIVTKKDNKYYVLDDKTMKELDFDLSAYNVSYIKDATKDRIMFTAYNPNGDEYTIIMNKDGSLVTEPILGDQGISFCDDNAILKSNTIINCKTGQTTKVDYEIKQVYSAYGMMVVYSGSNYYLVKPSEPDKLLSPFAIGQRV